MSNVNQIQIPELDSHFAQYMVLIDTFFKCSSKTELTMCLAFVPSAKKLKYLLS